MILLANKVPSMGRPIVRGRSGACNAANLASTSFIVGAYEVKRSKRAHRTQHYASSVRKKMGTGTGTNVNCGEFWLGHRSQSPFFRTLMAATLQLRLVISRRDASAPARPQQKSHALTVVSRRIWRPALSLGFQRSPVSRAPWMRYNTPGGGRPTIKSPSRLLPGSVQSGYRRCERERFFRRRKRCNGRTAENPNRLAPNFRVQTDRPSLGSGQSCSI